MGQPLHVRKLYWMHGSVPIKQLSEVLGVDANKLLQPLLDDLLRTP